MKIHAVIDTNVIVSAILTHNQESPTKLILAKVRNGQITPMINPAIMEEYIDVLSRSKFRLKQDVIQEIRCLFEVRGSQFDPEISEYCFIDPDDQVFYETYRMVEDAYLITGNKRHYPVEPRIVSPTEMISVIELAEISSGNILSEPACEYLSDERQARLQRAWEAIERCRRDAEANGTADMSMEEINEEIRRYRESR